MRPRFLIPSVLWYGLSPTVAGVAPAPASPLLGTGWGGQMTGEDDVRAVLLTLEPVLVLLTLAGYQVPEVAIGIPAGAAPTPADDLVVVRPETMQVERGSVWEWPLVVGPAVVGLWVVPRYPVAAPAEAAGPTLALDGLELPDPNMIELAPPDPGGSWLRLMWAPASQDSWPVELSALVQSISDALVDELVRQRTVAYAADPDDMEVPLCGLLGLYDPRTWREPAQLSPLAPLTYYVDGFGDRLTELVDGNGGFVVFLDGERRPPPDASADPPEPGPPTVEERWLDGSEGAARETIVEDLSFCATELQQQTYDAPLTDPRASTFAGTAALSFQQLSITQALLFWQEVGVLDFMSSIDAAVDEIYGTSLYGGWALRRGDTDTGHVYEGQPRTEPVPGAGEKGYVAQLRHDLAELGFGPQFAYAAGESGTKAFDVDLERAVREFQIAAAAPGGARYKALVDEETPFYADHLVGITNPDPYIGPISGVVNARTRALIRAWLDDFLRCPVVIEARVTGPGDEFSEPYAPTDADNLWKPHHVESGTPRMFARDFSRRWTLPTGSVRDLGDFVLGEWTQARDHPAWKGPRIYAGRECWAECEVTPDTLTGAAASALGAESASTFRVVRAVSEVECQAFFDGIQCWDDGVLSLGLCHWTIGLPLDPAELPAYLAYLKGLGGADGAAYEAAFGAFGCSPVKSWPAGTSQSGTTCWNDSQRKYTSPIALEDDAGRPDPAPVADPDTKEWFRHWHWMLRFAMAARTVEPFRRRMWEMARIRLRDILEAPFPPVVFLDESGTPVQATLGEVFTSERTVALLLRWHVNAPGHLFPPPGRLGTAYNTARAAIAGDWGDPRDWTGPMEVALHDAVYNAGIAAKPELRDTLPLVQGWGRDGTRWRQVDDWGLDYASIFNTPRIRLPENASTPVDRLYEVALDIDWRHVVPGFEPSARVVVVDDDDVLASVEVDPGGARLTATPNFGAAGDAIITVIADNGSQIGSTAFWLTVGGDAKPAEALAPSAEAPTGGLSLRRDSFRLLSEDLP